MKAELAHNAGSADEFPTDGQAEVALLGRSNVGKSSLINALVGQRALARTSGRPGRTRRIHFYRLTATGSSFYLVDLPGYGYAAVPREERLSWRALVESYLRGKRRTLRGAVLVVDLRRGCEEEEHMLLEWLAHEGIEVGIAFTKSDKLPPAQRAARLRELEASLSRARPGAPIRVCAVSGRSRLGLDTLRAWIAEWTGCEPWAPGGP